MKPPYRVPSFFLPWFYAGIAIFIGCIGIAVWTNFVGVQNHLHDIQKSEAIADSVSHPFRKRQAPRNDFIGSSACGECHPQIAETYRSHSFMANSLWDSASSPTVEDFADRNSFSPDGRHFYSVEKTPDGVFHHERLADDKGQTIYDQSVQVDYVMGSGHQGRSYLIDRGGLLFMSPITWYSHASRWDLSPQYKLPVHKRFERRIVNDCVDCHTGRLNSMRGVENRLGTPRFFEMSIGCERCHGPGGEHANLHRNGSVEIDFDPIVNPSKLDSGSREDICAQCHLSGEGHIPRIGCEISDFRPGQRLEETCIIFVEGTRATSDGTTRAVSQVEQMRSSRCFKSSDGKFGCVSCHDAHSRPPKSEMESFYRQKCLSCHANQGCSVPEAERLAQQADDSCTACHMPRLGANDVPHTSQTDHRVLRKPTFDEWPDKPPELPEFYDRAETRLPQFAVDYARGLWLAEHASKKNDREMAGRAFLLLSAVAKQAPNDVRVLDALGAASATRGKLDDSLNYWRKSLSIDPEHEKTIESIAILLHGSGRVKEARPYLEKFLQLNPWKASIWGRYSFLLAQENEWDKAIDAAKKAEELDPSVPQTYRFLADAYLQVGNPSQSQRYREIYERIQRALQ